MNPFGDAFSDPEMWAKLTADPSTRAFLQQPEFVKMMQEIQKNPSNLNLYLKDQRVMQALGVLLNVKLRGGTGADDEEMPESPPARKQPEPWKEEEDDVCRIYGNPDDADNPLRGSITAMLANARHLCELGGQDVDREDEEERNGARATRRTPGQANRNFIGDVNGEDAAEAQGIAGAGQMIRRNAETVAARWEMQAARLEAHVEQCLMVWMMLMAPRMYRLMSLGFLALPRSLRLCKTLILWNDVSSHYLEQEQGKPRDDGLQLEVCSILSLSPSSAMAGSATGSGCALCLWSVAILSGRA
ncbi:hypothetical protein ACFX1S_019804 [Malus domestica]